MATTTIAGDYEALTVTRVNNNYANAESVGRISAWRQGAVYGITFNFNPSTSIPALQTSFFKIATISGWNPSHRILQTIPSQTNNSTICVDVLTSGDVQIVNTSQTATGNTFFRANLITT